MDRAAEDRVEDVEDDEADYEYDGDEGEGEEDDVLDEDSRAPGLVPDPAPANVIAGRIELLDAIGEGATGRVLRGYHLKLEREVAVKILDDYLQLRVDGRERFLREARALGHLDHPGIVRVHDCDQLADGRLFLCMELLAGETLRALRERGDRLEPEQVIDIGIQVCAAVQSAHDRGILHRDLSASNIMLLREPPKRVKVIDWGLCKYLDTFWTRGEHRYGAPPGARLVTPLGARFGTPEYMAPELIRGDNPSSPTPSTDVYAFGVVLFELLTASHPFRPGDRKHPQAIASFVSSFDSPELEAAICRAIEHDPAARTQTMTALREDLERARRARAAPEPAREAPAKAAMIVPLFTAPAASEPATPGLDAAAASAHGSSANLNDAPTLSLAPGAAKPIGWLAAHKVGASLMFGAVLGSTGTLATQRASTWYEDQVTAPLKNALNEERSIAEAAALRADVCEQALDEVEEELATMRRPEPILLAEAQPPAQSEPLVSVETANTARLASLVTQRRRTSARTLDGAGPQVRACYDRYGGSKVASLAVRVTIDPGGRARDVQLLGDATSSALLRCVATAVQEHRYAPGPDTLTVRHAFALRKP